MADGGMEAGRTSGGFDRRGPARDDGGPADGNGGAPGKHTLVEALQRQMERELGTSAQVPGSDGGAMQQAAAQGLAGGSRPLPHGDTIQRAFGRHDVGGIEAHIGGQAETASRAIGAEAYATGNHVAFARAPSLHTAAHEAAHVVQQRAGVQLAGGVDGGSGDPYEQHADRVADAVVRGESAEALLDASPGGASQHVVQREPAPNPNTNPPPSAPSTDGPGAPPPQYASLDPRVRDLLWRSRDTYAALQGATTGDEFWKKLDGIGLQHLQTAVQVLKGADRFGLSASIQKLHNIYTWGSSWGLEFTGPRPGVGYPSWGFDLQYFVRGEHGDQGTANHNWYRHDSGAGNPGMHCGLDAGAGFHNLHWDPTNPMERVSDGITPAGWMPGPMGIPLPIFAPRGQAIYSASALIGHWQDLGKLPGGDPKPGANQPYLDITILGRDFADKTKLYADMETNAMADVHDKGRASAAIGALLAASSAAKALSVAARPIAMQDNETHKVEVDDLSTKLASAKTAMFKALAGFFSHLHAESRALIKRNDLENVWITYGMNIDHLHSTYDIVVSAQTVRAEDNKKAQKPEDPGDGGVPGGIDPSDEP